MRTWPLRLTLRTLVGTGRVHGSPRSPAQTRSSGSVARSLMACAVAVSFTTTSMRTVCTTVPVLTETSATSVILPGQVARGEQRVSPGVRQRPSGLDRRPAEASGGGQVGGALAEPQSVRPAGGVANPQKRDLGRWHTPSPLRSSCTPKPPYFRLAEGAHWVPTPPSPPDRCGASRPFGQRVIRAPLCALETAVRHRRRACSWVILP